MQEFGIKLASEEVKICPKTKRGRDRDEDGRGESYGMCRATQRHSGQSR